MNAILVGYGEVGKGLYEVLRKHHRVEIYDPGQGFVFNPIQEGKEFICDVLLVTIPYSEFFENVIKAYKDVFKPKNVIVFSTVPIGTCKKIGAVHSPIEGRHDKMAGYIWNHMRFIGGEFSYEIDNFFHEANLPTRWLSIPDFTEFLKLRSLAIYGVEIEMARYSGKIATKLGMSYDNVKRYDDEYNYLNSAMGVPIHRPILDPPNGKIGGHCVLQNMKILNQQYPHPMIQTVLDFNI